jgi:hypothetical protein
MVGSAMILIVVWASLLAVFLVLWLGLSRVGSHADSGARRAWRALMLTRLARRRGDRRDEDRRRRTAPIARERRAIERRREERRAELVAVDLPTAGRGLELVGSDRIVS